VFTRDSRAEAWVTNTGPTTRTNGAQLQAGWWGSVWVCSTPATATREPSSRVLKWPFWVSSSKTRPTSLPPLRAQHKRFRVYPNDPWWSQLGAHGHVIFAGLWGAPRSIDSIPRMLNSDGKSTPDGLQLQVLELQQRIPVPHQLMAYAGRHRRSASRCRAAPVVLVKQERGSIATQLTSSLSYSDPSPQDTPEGSAIAFQNPDRKMKLARCSLDSLEKSVPPGWEC
jgi:hypothetical protein